MEGVTAGLTTVRESGAFALDTRLLSDNGSVGGLRVATDSPAFTLDTRLPQQNPLYTNLIVTAEYFPFTIDTLNGWLKAPAQTLVGGSTGGKARFSPDGLRLAKADGARILLWNLHSIRTNFTFTGHAAEVATLDFSPLGDQLLTGSADGTLRWWDTASRAELGRTNPPGAGTVYAAYASDGARIIAGRGANAALYRVPALQLLQEFTGSAGSISAVAVCPEGLALAGNSDRFALVWNTATGQILCRLTNHTKLITAAAFFPGGTNAMTASLDGTIRLWNTTTGVETLRIPAGAQVGDAALSLDGRVIASCDTANPGTAYIWDAQTGSLLRIFTDTGSEASQIKGVALSPDQTALATTHVDGLVRLWNTGLDPRPIYPVTPLGIGTNSPVTLRSHGLYYFEMNADAGRSLVVTLEADPGGGGGSQLKRSADIPVGISGGLSSDAEFANLGAAQADKNVGAPTSKSLQTPPPGADITAFRMTATKGYLPSVYDYETFAQASVTNLHCEMPMATSTSDKVYVLVFAPYLSAGTIQARIRAEYADFHLSSVTPARGGNGGTVTAQFLGTGLTPDTTARLFNAGGTNVAGQLSLWGDSTKAWFSFDLSGAPAGSYSVEISRAGYVPAVLTDAFTVVTGGTPLLQARLSGPAAVRSGRDYSLTLEYANAGDVDIAAPLFIVSAPTGKNWLYPLMPTGPVLPLNPAQKRPQIQTMGPNPVGPVHLLPPGSRNEIPLYFQGDGGVAQMPFTLSLLRVDPTPIDWPALESQLRPPDMAADLWAALWANFKALAGNTWADYSRILNIQAYIRANSGQPTTDVAELLASLFSEAVGAPYRRTLFATVDASAPAPALPLQFARFTTDGLEHRFSLGPLGRGWSHNYEYTLTQPASDKIIIRTPGGGGRRFDRGSDNVWRGQTGDYATLAVGAGWFVLTEKDGLSRQFDAGGLLVSIEEPNHNRVTLSYSGSQLTGLAHSAGPSFTLQYNAQGRLARLTDHAGQVTDYEYDPAGEHLLRVVSPGAVTNIYTYQPVVGSPSDHALASITFPDGTHQFFGWNSMGRLAEQSRDGGAERLRFTYSSGGVVSVRDDRNAVTTLRLGERGQLLQMTDALGHGVTFNYDASFNLTRLTGPAGDTTEMAYDAQGNASSVINPLAQTVTLGHTALSRLDTLRDARHQLTDFGYDTRGNLTSIAYPDTSAEQFGYDTAGSVNTWQNRRGQTVQFARNAQVLRTFLTSYFPPNCRRSVFAG
jgi:YD repeat-containing protein